MKDPHGQPELPKPDLRATAVAAAFIALMVGLLTGLAGIAWTLYVVVGIEEQVTGLEEHARDSSVEIGHTNLSIGVVVAAIGLLWFVGAFLLLVEKAAGRVLLILASGVGLIASAAQLFTSGCAYLVIPIMVSLLILVLCVVPATPESPPRPGGGRS
ncbi:hypothetical protein [Nocardia mikamii]|uniref:hypothetical protein n=1 Tax=Nocardia mikamii TaxID=508464 RepID=UPI0007A4E195|nr:hypothetical protein [Nocardia mikamii]